MQHPAKHSHAVLREITDGLVSLLKDFYGSGPAKAHSYYTDDLVVCVLHGGFSAVEQTLLDAGRPDPVIAQRMVFQNVMQHRFEQVVEHATGRAVVAFMSGNQHGPDIMSEVFLLGDELEPDA